MSPSPRYASLSIALHWLMLVLLVAATFFPFLDISVQGFGNKASILDSATAFQSGPMALLSVAVAAMILVIPLLRMMLVLYVLMPIVRDETPFPHARRAFRLSQKLKPWAMAEIFAIGCAVALVKVAGLAHITIGPAFWAFVALVIVTVFKDNFMSRVTVWKTLEARRPS